MKVPHNISDKSRLSFAEVCCYREDEHGRKTMEKVPNRATVLFNNPEVRNYIDLDQSGAIFFFDAVLFGLNLENIF